jgi:biotin carboxylase
MADSTSNGTGTVAPPTLLIVSGGCEAVPVILEAKRLGLRVLVSDGAPDAPGFRLADAGLLASTYDPEATVEAARAYACLNRVDGVLAAAADVPQTVAAVAHALGLPGPSLATAALAADKLAMKHRLAAAGVAVPWYAAVEDPAHLETLAAHTVDPLIVKPVDSRGARGVVRLLPGVDPTWAWRVAAAESPTGRVMVERFVAGPQVSTESIVCEGETTTIGFSDRNYELLDRYAPFVIENGGDLPSALPAATRAAIETLVARAAAALGVRQGTVKGDVVVGPEGPMVIELAVRLSGGLFCSHEIPLATGVNFVEAAIRLALGERLDPAALVPRWSQGVAQRWLFPPPGTVVAVEGVAEAAAAEGVALVDVRVGPGDDVAAVTSHPRRAGVVIAVGDDREEAVRRAVGAAGRVRIVTVPAAPSASAALH